MKKINLLLITCLASFSLNITKAQTQSDIIEVKKSIIKALILEIDPAYLNKEQSGDNFWFDYSFYKNTKKIKNIKYILNETSKIKPHGGHSIVIDGDKVKKITGIYIDDIPGYGVVVYDRNINTYKKYNKITDGDSKVFNNQQVITKNKKEIIVFDCLTEETGSCNIYNKFTTQPINHQLLEFNNYNKKKQNIHSFDMLKYYEQIHVNKLVIPIINPRNFVKNTLKLSFKN